MKRHWRVLQFVLSLLGVATVTWLGYDVARVNPATMGLAYLLLILVIASVWGFAESALASFLAALSFNFFFLEPRWTFTIADPQNWAALASFLATALIASSLSTTARRRAQDALERQQDLERLYTFGRSILLVKDSEPFEAQLILRLAESFQLEGAVLFDRRSGELYRAGPKDLRGVERPLRDAAMGEMGSVARDQPFSIVPVRLGTEPIASLALEGKRLTDPVLQSVANLVAIGLERARSQALAREVEVARRSERLRTTLIDAMAHELKTPLTSIRAATSALLSSPGTLPPNAPEMIRIADEEATRLQELIDNALDMAQLDSDHIDLELDATNLNDLVRETLVSYQAREAERLIEFRPGAEKLVVLCDSRLVRLSLRQLLDNALKYSPDAEPVVLHTFRRGHTAFLEITDRGRGISASDQARIFERFFRGASVQEKIPGSGLGLSIAHRILQAHGGELTVRSRPGETTFTLSLPVENP